MLPLASTPPSQAKPSSITSSSDQQARANEKRPSPPANSQESNITHKAESKRKKTGLPYRGHITLTKELLHFLHKAPDKGAHTRAKIAQRQILRAAACASKVRTILYDIFMEPLDDIYISRQLEKGQQHLAGTKQHKHSMGVSPRYAFATLLLKAAANEHEEPLQRINGQISKHSIHIHKRLRQITAEFDITTRTAALTFNYGHCYQHLTPSIIEELKRHRSIPWPIILNDQE